MSETTEKWETKESPDIILEVREAQIRQLYEQTWGGLTGVFATALSVCIVLWHVLPHWQLLLWGGILVLLSIARGFLGAAFQRRSPSGSDIYRWAKLHVIGVALSGLMWALPPFFLWPAKSLAYQLVWTICILGLAAAAVAKYHTWTPSYLSYLILTAVPISLRLLSEGGLAYIVLGLLGLFYTAVLGQAGKLMNTATLRALIVGVRNEVLNSVLSDEKVKQEELNVQLKQEIEERTRSQEELRLRNQELERLNTQITTTKTNLESANKELERALTNVKQLSGMLPICASCKKIRNDKGYWEQIEIYVRDHSEAQFSHGICPECAKTLYPEYYDKT